MLVLVCVCSAKSLAPNPYETKNTQGPFPYCLKLKENISQHNLPSKFFRVWGRAARFCLERPRL